jgi:hypothetical protein
VDSLATISAWMEVSSSGVANTVIGVATAIITAVNTATILMICFFIFKISLSVFVTPPKFCEPSGSRRKARVSSD